VPYYLYKKVLVLLGNIEVSQAPPPPTGAGLAQGGDHLKKKGFYRKKIIKTERGEGGREGTFNFLSGPSVFKKPDFSGDNSRYLSICGRT